MRLPRSRRGKTPIDVTPTEQNGLPRVRVSVGNDNIGGRNNRVNTDMDLNELDAFITILQYMKAVVFEGLEDDDGIGDD